MPNRFFSVRFSARAFLACALIAMAGAASAQTADASHNVVIPLGDIITPLASIVSAIASAIIASLFAKYGGPVAKVGITDQLLKRAIDFGIATVNGAARGKEVTIPIANDILRAAAQYAATNAPRLTQEIGDTLTPKLIARLGAAVELPPDASAANLTGAK